MRRDNFTPELATELYDWPSGDDPAAIFESLDDAELEAELCGVGDDFDDED